MLWKKTNWFWNIGLTTTKRGVEKVIFVAFGLVLFGFTGCSRITQTDIETTETESTQVQVLEQSDIKEAEEIAEIYLDIYDNSVEANTSFEVVRSIVNRLGENGYVAVDSENQINMTEIGQVIQFCERVDEGEEAELIIVVISYSDEFIKYNFKTKDGNVDIVREYYKYESGQLNKMSTSRYRANSWQYTKEGYLVFDGCWYSEEYYVLSLGGVEEHTALRVQPLDEKCREYNRRYILPVGYGHNNMFLFDWSEDDFGELNFYDLFDIFYPIVNHESVPYVADENAGVGAIYRIPRVEFESVIKTYFNIDSETLQNKTTYFSEDEMYEYKPRGFYEVEYSDIPYPEVVDYIENNDGTITLTVNAVYPRENTSKLYVHEVVIRPLDDSCFQYIANRIVASADEQELCWHTDRLSEEEWEQLYGGFE